MVLLPLIAVLLLIGIATGSSWFALVTSAMLTAFYLAKTFSEKWAESVQVERTLSTHETEIGDRVRVGLKLTNRSGWLIPWMLIEDLLPKRAMSPPTSGLQLGGTTTKLLRLGGKQQRIHTYDLLTLRRGFYRIGPTLVETGDLLGLHRKHRILAESDYLLVLPKLVPLEGLEIATRRPMGEMRVHDRILEDPTQMVGIRAYRAGDPLNRVHWKATARTGTLHSRVFQPTSMQGAMLVLDMHRDSNPDRHEPVRTDLAVTMAASIAHALYRMNQPFGLITNGRDAAQRYSFQDASGSFTDRAAIQSAASSERKLDRLRPIVHPAGTGPELFLELHRTLARLERTDGLRLEDLIAETESRMARHLAMVFVLQGVDESMALSLGLLRKRGFSVSVILNRHPLDSVEDAAAMLVAQRLPLYLLPSEESIPSVCTNLLLMR
ncbi:DUF58 domain-containing protein [Pirellulaceae bacterium SH467]